MVLTVEEFGRLPQPCGGIRQELHHGTVVEFEPARLLHTRVQRSLIKLLYAHLGESAYFITNEFPYRPEPEYEVWVADIAVVPSERLKRTGDDEYFGEVPTVVIEVLSSSNTGQEMLDRERMCLRNGGREFWLVDPKRETVKVIQQDGRSRVFGVDESVVSPALGVLIAVREIYS